MSLAIGTRLGPYEILASIGAGGMGEVYKARDTRLDRTVAVKICAEQFSERFEREAHAIAALNHPNICTLHDVGPNYLVMEYIEGHPAKGPLPLDQALRLAIQIADAQDAAHRKGIVHRDLKPANILVTKSGVKLLDFGLAKIQPTVTGGDATLTATAPGTIMGTLHYMSPEQVQGKEMDARSDVFSLGIAKSAKSQVAPWLGLLPTTGATAIQASAQIHRHGLSSRHLYTPGEHAKHDVLVARSG